MNDSRTQPNTYTVKITFFSSDNEDQEPIEENEIYATFPLGTPLPHVGDSIGIDDALYRIKNRGLMISNIVVRNAVWNLLVERPLQP